MMKLSTNSTTNDRIRRTFRTYYNSNVTTFLPLSLSLSTLVNLNVYINKLNSQCEQNIHNHILSSDRDYNIAVPPIVSYDEPLFVNTDVVLEYPEEIEVMTGTARIFVSIVMEWKDPRLAWEINEENCADYINVYTGYDQGTYNKVVAAVVVVKNRNEANYKNKQYKYQKTYLFLTLIMYRFSSFILNQKRHQFGSPILTY